MIRMSIALLLCAVVDSSPVGSFGDLVEIINSKDDANTVHEESDSEEEGPGLAALYDNTANLDEDDDSADFEADDAEAAEDDDEDIDDDDEDEEASGSKGVKRKLEDD